MPIDFSCLCDCGSGNGSGTFITCPNGHHAFAPAIANLFLGGVIEGCRWPCCIDFFCENCGIGGYIGPPLEPTDFSYACSLRAIEGGIAARYSYGNLTINDLEVLAGYAPFGNCPGPPSDNDFGILEEQFRFVHHATCTTGTGDRTVTINIDAYLGILIYKDLCGDGIINCADPFAAKAFVRGAFIADFSTLPGVKYLYLINPGGNSWAYDGVSCTDITGIVDFYSCCGPFCFTPSIPGGFSGPGASPMGCGALAFLSGGA